MLPIVHDFDRALAHNMLCRSRIWAEQWVIENDRP